MSAGATSVGQHGEGENYDLFVSYAHDDNEATSGVEHGWVTILAGNLAKVLRRKLGDEGRGLWMDHLLAPNQPVSTTLREGRVACSRALLAVLSPGYRKSAWCRIELEDFLAASRARGNGNGIFAIEVEPVDRLQLHEALQSLKSIVFWERSFGIPVPRLLGFPQPNPNDSAVYWDRVTELAQAIANHLGVPPPPPPVPPTCRPVETWVLPQPPPLSDPVVADDLSLYLHAAPEDQPSAELIADHLVASGLTVLMTPLPSAQQTYLDCLQEQQHLLGMCDGLLLVNGLSPVNNLQAAFMMAQRAFGVRRPGVWGAALNLRRAAGAQIPLRSPKLMQLDCSEGFSVAQLMPFLHGLRANGAVPRVVSHV